MTKPREKSFLANYLAMALLLFCIYFAFKLSGTVAAVLSVVALLVANPALQFPSEITRWLILILLLLLIFYTFPDLMQLKEIANTV